jgi:hypothetical protein
MSVILEFSAEEEDTWQVANRIFFWFEGLIESAYAADPVVLQWVDLVSSISGYRLHKLAEEQPDIARRLIEALRATAERVGRAEHPIPDGLSSDPLKLQSRFSDLATRLRAFEVESGKS